MKSSTAIRNSIAHYGENELIFASKLYKEELHDQINETAYYKMLERMCRTGELSKVSKGIYCIPIITKYGPVPPSEKEIVKAFTENATGLVVGYTMYNKLNLTTQVSKTIDVLSSSIEGFSKTIRNVVIKQVEIDYTEEVNNMICGLEVLQNFNRIQDINYLSFIDFSQKLAATYQDSVFEMVISKISYKKSTISFLRELLNYYGTSNNLEKYLSSLSNYKHPKMEELYEIARTSNGI